MILTSIKYIIYVHYYKIYDNLDVIIEHWWQDWYSLSLSLSLITINQNNKLQHLKWRLTNIVSNTKTKREKQKFHTDI